MADDTLHAVLRNAEGQQFRFTFGDGEGMHAEVVSSSHVDEDDTVVLHRVDAAPGECSWQVHLADIQLVETADGRRLYHRGESPVQPSRAHPAQNESRPE